MTHINLNPTLIFAENHQDPITYKILTKLVPKLRSLGYECFFAELEDIPVEVVIQRLEEQEQEYQRISKITTENGINIEDKSALFEMCIMHQLKKTGITDSDQLAALMQAFTPRTLEYIELYFTRRLANLARKDFSISLLENGINFKGIDLEDPLADLKSRDQNMVNAYLSSKQSTFGKIGFCHASGMQSEILKIISNSEQASAMFCFFNIFSKPLCTPDEYEEVVRQGKTIFPLGMISVDATNKNEDDVTEIVFQEILKRQEKLNNLTQLNSLPNLSLSSSRDGFFAFAELKNQNHVPQLQPLKLQPLQ